MSARGGEEMAAGEQPRADITGKRRKALVGATLVGFRGSKVGDPADGRLPRRGPRHRANRSISRQRVRLSGGADRARSTLSRYERHDLRGEALQALDAFGYRLAAKIEN